jgi:hypothetical protein
MRSPYCVNSVCAAFKILLHQTCWTCFNAIKLLVVCYVVIGLLRVDIDSFLINFKKSLSRKLLHIFRGHSGNSPSLAVLTETCYNTTNVSTVTLIYFLQ